ncbi:MAG TPA: Hsp20/alpha crystallin family protein [Thermomicrobiaceae bacterium]|nr:Hsp20/alpha crystallin family protein [Thermomicrobiaceae bacterium]
MLTRYPMVEFAQFFNDVNRLFNATQGGTQLSAALQPPVDLYETGDELVLKALIPGVTPGNLNVTIEQNVLTISGRYPQFVSPEKSRQVTWYRKEIPSGQFTEQLSLPVQVDGAHVQATFENGVLTLTLPKAEHARARQIQIQPGASEPALAQANSSH